MAQKKKASAARTATVHATAPTIQLGSPPVWFISSANYEGSTGQALAPPEPHVGMGLEISSSDKPGGEHQLKKSLVTGRGDSIGKAHGEKVAANLNGNAHTSCGLGGSANIKMKNEAANYAVVRVECERALVAYRRGNSTKALRLIKDSCIRNENSGLAHRVQGHIFMRLASVIEDTTTKHRHLFAALESARKAASLSPKSVEFAHFYAQLLYEAAKDSKGYEEVVRECERALLIDDPVDPAKESLHNEQQQELPTPEARIAHVQQELKGLVQKANITTWMKTLGNGAGEEKLRFIQTRKFADQDPMEQRVFQPKRPHEVKKVVKTPEERRKEIEVRVAAARLLQQRENLVTNVSTEAPEEPEKAYQKRLDRRKSGGPNARKLAKALSTEERIDRVRQFWRLLAAEKREAMLEVFVAGLKNYLGTWREIGGTGKSHAASDILSEALEFAQEKKTWRFWACCKCGERFIDYQDLIQHAMGEHIGSLPQNLQEVIPQEIHQDWMDHLLDNDCRPIDGAAAVRMLIECAHFPIPEDPQPAEIVSSVLEPLKESEKSEPVRVKGTEDTPSYGAKNLETVEDVEAGLGQVSGEVDQVHLHICNGDCQKGKNITQAGKDMPQDFPLVEDEERRKALDQIYVLFRVLIRNKCLAKDHVMKIIQYATDEVQSLVPDPSVHYEFNQSPLYIRFLEKSPLDQIHKYLMELVQACGLNRFSDSAVPPNSGEISEEEIIQDRLFLNEDFTQLLLDDRVLKEFPEDTILPCEKLEDGEATETVVEKGEVARRPPLPLMTVKDGDRGVDHVDLQLSWVYGSMDYEYQPSGWKQFREEQGQQGRNICRALEKECQQLRTLCDKKYDLVSFEEALELAERVCVEENKRREHGTGRSYETVLKERQQELIHYQVNGLSPHKLELDAISKVLRDARTAMVQRHRYDGVRISDSDEDEDEAWRMQESMPRADSRVDTAIFKQKEQLSNEINHVDAQIMKTMDDLQKMEVKLGQTLVLDYRAVVLPLVKGLIKSRLEAEADKDAMEKSDAAQKAFLAELAKDQKSSGGKDVDTLKHFRDRSKDKKKVKKLKDVKHGPLTSGQDKEEEGEVNSVALEEIDDADNWDWVEEEDGKQGRNVDVRRQAEMWEEERKLVEALELQRCVEEEAKEKHLAEQERKKLAKELVVRHLEDGEVSTSISLTVDKEIPKKVEPFMEGNPVWLPLDPTGFDDPSILIDSTMPKTKEKTEASQLSTNSSHAQLFPVLSEPPVTQKKVCHIAAECLGSENSTLGELEQRRLNSTSKEILEKLEPVEAVSTNSSPASNGVLLSGDGDQPTGAQKKTRGSGSRHRRKRGPRIYAEEGILVDQEVQSSKASGSSDGLKPLLRQNASKVPGSQGVNGMHQTYPLLLLRGPVSAEGTGEHEVKKTLRQLQAEQDEEERYQADLEQAMRQSLDMLTLQSTTSGDTGSVGSSPYHLASPNLAVGDPRVHQLAKVATSDTVAPMCKMQTKDVEEVGKGLRNEIGQYNCFLNVVIQSLWHLKQFREELLADTSMQHVHGEPCVVCALHDIFVGLKTAACDGSSKDAEDPTPLRIALSAHNPNRNNFQEAQMNDASEVLAVIFDCLHEAFVPNHESNGTPDSSSTEGSGNCQEKRSCMAHSLFGLDVAEQMNCQGCGRESRHLKYRAFFHIINASALRTAKVLYQESSMDELLKLVDMNHQLACDVGTGGCGQQNYIHHFLHSPPHVFTTVLGWQNGCESFEDISVTVDAIDVGLDVGVVYQGLDKGSRHRLVSVVCYYGQHYHCFAYNQELARWVMFDDSTVKVIGEWTEVASTCRRGHLQPQVLFYEAASAF